VPDLVSVTSWSLTQKIYKKGPHVQLFNRCVAVWQHIERFLHYVEFCFVCSSIMKEHAASIFKGDCTGLGGCWIGGVEENVSFIWDSLS